MRDAAYTAKGQAWPRCPARLAGECHRWPWASRTSLRTATTRVLGFRRPCSRSRCETSRSARGPRAPAVASPPRLAASDLITRVSGGRMYPPKGRARHATSRSGTPRRSGQPPRPGHSRSEQDGCWTRGGGPERVVCPMVHGGTLRPRRLAGFPARPRGAAGPRGDGHRQRMFGPGATSPGEPRLVRPTARPQRRASVCFILCQPRGTLW